MTLNHPTPVPFPLAYLDFTLTSYVRFGMRAEDVGSQDSRREGTGGWRELREEGDG